MAEWIISEEGFYKDKIEDNGNKFLIGNGYMGVRGTLEEYSKVQLAAINLAGIYDKVGNGWREPLNAPNALYTLLKVDGVTYSVLEKEPAVHTMSLDYRKAVFFRHTEWKNEKGHIILDSERFMDMQSPHFLYMKYTVTLDYPAKVEILTGIDGDVWDIYGPHYAKLFFDEGFAHLFAEGITGNRKETVWVGETIQPSKGRAETICEEKKWLHQLKADVLPGESIGFTKQVVVYTTKDRIPFTGEASEWVKKILDANATASYMKKRQLHIAHWEKLWENSEVFIEGDDKAMEALNYSLYHLHSIAPRHSKSLSIAARGLSGQTYKGAVFWDTEMFMLDFFLFTEPAVAKTLLKYRIDTLTGARQKAEQYGYEGAFYAWESQEGGYDACSDYNVTDVFTGRPMRTFFRDKQIHISAAIVHGIMRYVDVSGDTSLLEEGGIETILECARFYYSMLLKKVSQPYYELHDVIGPDEYHERVNNNGYTNRMAKFTMEAAVELLKKLDTFSAEVRNRIRSTYAVDTLLAQLKDAAEKLYLPVPTEDGVIPQFDGYRDLEDVSVEEVRSRLLHEKEYWGGAYGVASHTQVIKQADVVTWLTLFSNEFSEDILQKNWEYYEPRTEHGSSLSACMYACLACICGFPEKAYPFFIKSATADLVGGGKQWAGLVYIGGSHPAAAGGAYMTAIKGFAGVRFENGEIKINPNLPQNWKRMRFKICYHSVYYQIEIVGKDVTISKCIE